MRRGLAAAAVLVSAGVPAGCGGRNQAPPVLRVPSAYATIQQAVDAAQPGDLVLIAPGVYRQSVTVAPAQHGIVVRGLDRNRVILDGGDHLADGIAVHADGVAIENLTVRRYLVNGVLWSPAGGWSAGQLEGWRGSYLTAYDNGLYGVYAFGARHGRFDHVYASGQPDSGIYVGRCDPCHALVTASVAEHNQVGYEATNASVDVRVIGNVLRANRVGLELNSLQKEGGFPQHGSLVEGNVVADNDDRAAPQGQPGFGAGIVVNGGSANVVRGNRVEGHDEVGIAVLDSQDGRAADNVVRGNRLARNAVDIALETGSGRSQGNCFRDNSPAGALRSVPAEVGPVTGAACGRSVWIGVARLALLAPPPEVDYRSVAPPPAQPSMPGAATAPPRPAVGRPERNGVA